MHTYIKVGYISKHINLTRFFFSTPKLKIVHIEHSKIIPLDPNIGMKKKKCCSLCLGGICESQIIVCLFIGKIYYFL